uniref:proline-rich protein 18 isoform X2 n=1 Tax=Scatophagus argus TaxID=75038 RepID=UPI001ED858E5|nr:proline-rich protein 18 isoform X2 [Scatophagus argus]
MTSPQFFSWLCLVPLLATPSCQPDHKAARLCVCVHQLNSCSVRTTGALQPLLTALSDNARRAPLVALRRASSSALWTLARFYTLNASSHKMPFPPINLHQRISSPGRELFGKKKANGVPPQPELTSKPGREKAGSDKEKQSISWTSANLRNLGRKAQQEKSKRPPQKEGAGQETQGKCSWLTVPKPQDSSEGVRRSSSMDSTRELHDKEEGKKEIQFTLSLTPEAILVIQKRNLEKQMMAKQQKCCASADFRHRRVFPSKKAHGASKGCAPVAKVESAEQDITAIVKISLLNDQYKYDDVEYEEEDGDVDETVVRKY